MQLLLIFLLLAPLPTRTFEIGAINWLPFGEKTSQKDIDLAVTHTLEASDHILVQLPWSPSEDSIVNNAEWMAGIAHKNNRKLTIAIDWQDPSRKTVLKSDAGEWKFSDFEPGARFIDAMTRLALRYKPDVLVVGVEVNYYAKTHAEDFREFTKLYPGVRRMIKGVSPNTKVLVTFQYELLSGKDASWKSKEDLSPIEAFGDSLDMLGIATYPHLAKIKPIEFDSRYFSSIDRFKLPWGIFETSWPTVSSEEDQAEYLHRLLDVCQQRNARLLIWTGTTDTAGGPVSSEKKFDEASRWFLHLGLFDLKGEPKRSVREWMDWRSRDVDPH